jgi:superfamily I DNA/RNA helicase
MTISPSYVRIIRWFSWTRLIASCFETVRYNALSRPIELELQKQQIPSRLIGGHKFFERVEVKDLLAYLQLVDNPNYYVSIEWYIRKEVLADVLLPLQPAFARVVNVPKRSIGDKVSFVSPAFGLTWCLMAGRI